MYFGKNKLFVRVGAIHFIEFFDNIWFCYFNYYAG